MWKWLRNNIKFASILGVIILIALIWFFGGLIGLTVEVRLICIVCVFAIWVVALLLAQAQSARAGGFLEKFLRSQADDAVMEAGSGQRAEIARLRQGMLSAIDTLKSSNIGKSGGKATLYELPWYMIIGHSAAGKSTAIRHSGLTFPFGDKLAIQGVGGTRDCDWFFSTEGVLIDTAGRYATQREDRPEWLGFLRLLKKYRPKAPVNGILVAISFPELLTFKSEEFVQYAHQVRERINEIDDAFGIKVPIYLIFTKIDLLGGFTQFFDDLSEEDRQQVWGATLSHDQGIAFDAKRVVDQHLDELYRGLTQIGTEKLANNRGNLTRPALFAFPIEFNAMREAIDKFVGLLFQDDPYHTKPLLRGFYFTSALQEGTPRIAAGTRVSSQFDLAKPGFDAAQIPTSNGFFLRNLFREVLFPDQHLVSRQIKPANSRLRMAGLALGLLLLAGLAGGLTWSYVGNQKLVATANEEMAAARSLSDSGELIDQLTALQILQLRLEQLYRYRKNGHPFMLGMGLYQGDKVERAMRAEYFAGVKNLMLTPVTASLEHTLVELHPGMPAPQPVSAPAPAAPAAPVKETPAAPAVTPPPPVKHKPSGKGGLPSINLSSYSIPVGGDMPSFQYSVYHSDGKPHFMLATQTFAASASANAPVTAPAPAAATPAAGNPMENGYNALKTYLMLQQKERMEVAHLSDQLPKYWRAWLETHRGKGSPDEINRLAERVVAFYVSQIGEPDLPLIQNRADVVASSREVLSQAMHQLPGKVLVYNELKSRANVQFAPMTVGRILNNNDLNLVAGSYAVPGAFTREAWNNYFNAAITAASKGGVEHDDWVLAVKNKDDLSNDGDVAHNRAEIEALYKADYAAEWKKFLQGVAIQDFGSLDNTAQALGKLSDPQNSAITLILTKAAYETAWDNPSQLSKSIDSAKDSIVKRTEALIQQDKAPAQNANASQFGEVGGKFAALAAMTNAGEGGRMPLSAYTEMLAKLKAKIAQIAPGSQTDGSGALKLMQSTTLNDSSSELAAGLALIDNVLLANVSDETKETVRPLLVRPLMQTYVALIGPSTLEINRAWQTEVMTPWHSLSSKYPFADSTNEAPMADIAKFLKPHDGVLDTFIEKDLAGLIVKHGEVLTPRTWANLGVSFSPAFLGGVGRLTSAGGQVLQEGDGAKFELQPVPTPGLSETLVEVDGQTLRYRNGPQSWTGFTWPNPAGQNAQGARIQAVTFGGVSTSVANFSGRLGLMRLLAQAKADNPSNPTVQLEWSFKAARAADDKSAHTPGDDTQVVRFNFRMVSGANPLSLSGLRRLNLPEKITN